MSRKTVSVNVNFDSDVHRTLRLLVNKTGLTNSEVVNALVGQLDFQTSLDMLKPAVEEKKTVKQERRRLKKEVEALAPEDVKRILTMIKKEESQK